MWGAALLVLVAMNDFGTSLLFFGVFVAMVYVATARAAYVAVGVVTFAVGAYVANAIAPQVGERLQAWLDPWAEAQGNGYQIVQSIYTIAEGGIFGQGLGKGYILTGAGRPVDPGRADRLHLLGRRGRARPGRRRGPRAALRARSPSAGSRPRRSRATASRSCSPRASRSTVALQAFIIIGGVTRLIPLTGITLPFVSYGGSSIVSNWALLALLLCVSDDVNRAARGEPR